MSDEIRCLEMAITKASFDESTGERRIRMVASDTSIDYYDERTSIELFHNFVRRANEPLPEVWKSVVVEKGWRGGMPYTSISHYPSGSDGANIPADIKSIYVDGNRLKSLAVARNTKLGNKLWEALRADLDGTSDFEEKIRVSIGFIDLKHSHGDFVFTRDTLESRCSMCENGVGHKVYLDGILVHEAFTRVPANTNTSAEVEKMSEINTREDDAKSIVGELAEELEVNKSTVDSILVVKDENAEEVVDDVVEEVDTVSTEQEATTNEVEEPAAQEEPVVDAALPIFDEPKDVFDLALESFKSKVLELKSLPRDEALSGVQKEFDALAGVVRGMFPEPSPEEVSQKTLEQVLSKVEELIGINKSLSEEVAILKAQKNVVPTQTEEPVRRSIVARQGVPTPSDKPMSIKELAAKSVFTN